MEPCNVSAKKKDNVSLGHVNNDSTQDKQFHVTYININLQSMHRQLRKLLSSESTFITYH